MVEFKVVEFCGSQTEDGQVVWWSSYGGLNDGR